ncbi:peptidase M4 family protein (plasmid) [Nostoc sp. C052]|uniref:M4 family metallopeptidase n=1 Tax=Nostoc sp. C052 TaxID=2576902 RepID=UPI0015C37048|nr:M4 family metallopeptidase [Nostoc sp. C052]QLE45087.1 peptidase M4 family protein [Nostoc sp. C052]
MARKKKKLAGFKDEHSLDSRCPICCIVPPHILQNVVVNGNHQQRSWAFQTLNISAQFLGRRNVVGNISFAPSAGEKRRTIYDAKYGQQLPGTLVRGEGDPPSSDAAVNEAYDAAGATYDLFHEIFDRNSVDDKGLRLDSTVHYGVKYDNAFWNGDQMVYGDGDGELFQRFTKSIDVIGHELTHGVTQYQAGLQYDGESGALNESFSDVFGSLVKQKINNQTAEEADWLIGQGLLASTVKGIALRSMKAPGTAYDDPLLGKDPQPAHVKDKYTGTDDNGGVHINSGIPNYAFYLAAVAIGGYAWEKAGKIWYITLRDRLNAQADFKTAANVTIQVAGELYGNGSDEQKAVQDAWQKVGVI